MNVSSEQLFLLYRDMIRIFPNTSIDDYADIILEDGYWDTRTIINIQTESLEEIENLWFSKGISYLRKQWYSFRENKFQHNVDKDLLKLSKLYKEKSWKIN